jgi:threonine synthase
VGDEIPADALKEIITETLCFDFPTVKVEEGIYALELYHGPTMAFKDVGARFMSRCLAYFNKDKKDNKNTVLVATSGDTGGAVASGFLGVQGVEVIILYPSGKVSDIQERQLTTLGQNIKALEVDGFFDDCQDMVKKAFLDESLSQHNLTSANSINIARWLPQMFYFFFAYKQLKLENKPLIFSCPSGNFGNICAGIIAKKMGLPIEHFVASTNVNDTVPRFMEKGNYDPKPSKATISNAMDVGNPSNFIRIQEMYHNDLEEFKKDFSSFSYTDAETLEAMQTIYKTDGYIVEPHGAIGYLGLKKELQNHPNAIGIFLETAHPIKFLDVVEPALNIKLPIPTQIESVLNKEKDSVKIKTYEELKTFLG